MKKFCRLVNGIGILAAVLLLYAYLNPRALLTSAALPAQMIMRLEALGDSALISRDVPVAALVIYGSTIIGEGYNTVNRDGDAGGHAEINAISAALRAAGVSRFRGLDRDALVLVTTFEPCVMCRGAIVEYDIRKVELLKRKSPLELVREDLRILRYYVERTISGPSSLQDTLFHRHPDYRGN